MAYNRIFAGSGPASLGWAGGPIDLGEGDVTIGDEVKAIEVVAAGALVYVPAGGSAPITVTDAPVGYQPPHHVGTVIASGTTATVVTVIG